MHTLFPEIEPFNTFRLNVSPVHELYVEECGNPNGEAALFLHGGPGAGIGVNHRRLFDPAHYRLVLFDQRGAGKSTPHASLEENTTWDLVRDIEKIRERLGIEKWVVFGGSWGSTLSLAYAQKHPQRVTALVLRGIFLCRPEELQWFYQGGCDWIYPDEWTHYEKVIPQQERGDMIQAYYRRLTGTDEKVRLQAAHAWSRWEGSTIRLIPDQHTIDRFETDHIALSLARIECHYFVNDCFFEKPNQLLADAPKIRHIPTWIVHGRYDVVCPAKSAWDLKQALPQARMHIVPDAGHAFDEPGILHRLIEATESLKQR